jgi:hypothetical protein
VRLMRVRLLENAYDAGIASREPCVQSRSELDLAPWESAISLVCAIDEKNLQFCLNPSVRPVSVAMWCRASGSQAKSHRGTDEQPRVPSGHMI